jgi:hypothetical protein
MLARADALAKRVAGIEPKQRTPRLYAQVYGRKPTPTEQEECDRFLTTGTVEQLAQVLLMSNEMMFVD